MPRFTMIRLLRSIKRYLSNRRRGVLRIDCDLDKVIVHQSAEFASPEQLKLEDYVRIGAFCHIDALGGIEIGIGTTLSPRVVILSSHHDYYSETLLPFDLNERYTPVKIGAGVWIAWGAQIFGGVTIGDGAIIAGGAVVTKDVSAGEIVAGNPARVVGHRNKRNLDRLLREESYFQKAVVDDGVRRTR